MRAPFTVMLPVRNEAATVGSIIEKLQRSPGVSEVLVIDNDSTDSSAELARCAGARVVHESQPGLGAVVRTGLREARHDTVIKVDADLIAFEDDLIERLAAGVTDPDVRLVKASWVDPDDAMPMTRRLIQPALRQLFPGLSGLTAPNSGIYMVDRTALAVDDLPDFYAVDIDVMLRVHTGGWSVREIDIGTLRNNPRNSDHYSAMADTIFALFLDRARQEPTRLMVAIAPRSESIVSGCFGTLCSHLSVGGCALICIQENDPEAATLLQPLLRRFPTARVTTPERLRSDLHERALHNGLTVINARESEGFVERWLSWLPEHVQRTLRRYTLPSFSARAAPDFEPALSVDISCHYDLKRSCRIPLRTASVNNAVVFEQACAENESWGRRLGVHAAEVFTNAPSGSGLPCAWSL